jgi:hypothetical protein
LTVNYAVAQFGSAGGVPQPADYTGDGRAELAVYRVGTWRTFNLTNNHASAVQFGLAGDKPVAADYDGDELADAAVYRGGMWHLLQRRGAVSIQAFGRADDQPVAAAFLP